MLELMYSSGDAAIYVDGINKPTKRVIAAAEIRNCFQLGFGIFFFFGNFALNFFDFVIFK